MYLIFRNVNGYFEEINKSKYLTLVPTNQSKEKIKKYKKLWSKIGDWIRSITKNSDDYNKKHMKIKFNSDDELSLDKPIKIPSIAIVVGAVFHENDKYYPQEFIDESLYKLYYDRIDVFEGIDVDKTSASKEWDVCHYWYFLNYSFKFQTNVCKRSHDVLIMSINLFLTYF